MTYCEDTLPTRTPFRQFSVSINGTVQYRRTTGYIIWNLAATGKFRQVVVRRDSVDFRSYLPSRKDFHESYK